MRPLSGGVSVVGENVNRDSPDGFGILRWFFVRSNRFVSDMTPECQI